MGILVGDHVHHPQHGIGEVQSIGERSFYGGAKASYVQLYFARDDLTLTLLEEHLFESTRKLITSKEARELLDRMKDWEGKPSSQWKARANAHQSAIDSGDPFKYFKVYKGLVQLEEEDTLRLCDKAHLSKSQDMLIEEIAHTLEKTPKQAHQLIHQAVVNSSTA